MKILQISSQFYLTEVDDDGNVVRVLDGPYSTREQAETMTKVYDL